MYNLKEIKDILKRNKVEVNTIDFKDIFKDLKASDFSIKKEVDNYLKEHNYAENIYKSNIVFQLSYSLLSDYIFKNKKEFLKCLSNIYDNLLSENFSKVTQILSTLDKQIKYRDIKYLVDKINVTLKDNCFLSKYKSILNDNKSKNNLNSSSISDAFSYLSEVILTILVHDGNINFNKFNITKEDIRNYSINLLKEKLGNDKQAFFNYMNSYYKNAFFFHGTNTFKGNKIEKNGLNGFQNINCTNKDLIETANDILERNGLFRGFEGKKKELTNINYYITDKLYSAVYYANQSPEYLSRFCANGHMMKKDCYDKEAFWRRDYKSCLKNIKKLCVNNNMTKKDKSFIKYTFDTLWDFEVDKDQYPIIYIGDINLVEERNDTKYNKYIEDIDTLTYEDIYDIFTTSSNVHNKRMASINGGFLEKIELPNTHKLLKKRRNKSRKYIVENNKKIYPDLAIYSAYCNTKYFVLSDEMKILNNVIYLDKKNFNYNLDNEKVEYMLLCKAIPISKKGQRVLKTLKNKTKFNKVLTYYKKLSIDLLKKYKLESDELKKMDIYNKFANDVFYIWYAMSLENKYFNEIDSGYANLLHYHYDKKNYWVRSKQQNSIEINGLDKLVINIENILANK